MSLLYGLIDFPLVLSPVRKVSGFVTEVTPTGRRRTFDNRSRLYKLVGDDTSYEVGYSTYRESPACVGDLVELTVCQIGSDEGVRDIRMSHGVAVSHIAITRARFWNIFSRLN